MQGRLSVPPFNRTSEARYLRLEANNRRKKHVTRDVPSRSAPGRLASMTWASFDSIQYSGWQSRHASCSRGPRQDRPNRSAEGRAGARQSSSAQRGVIRPAPRAPNLTADFFVHAHDHRSTVAKRGVEKSTGRKYRIGTGLLGSIGGRKLQAERSTEAFCLAGRHRVESALPAPRASLAPESAPATYCCYSCVKTGARNALG